MPMSSSSDVKKLQARISYLEDNRRFIQNALETVLSLGEFQTATENRKYDAVFLLEQAGEKIVSLIPFSAWAFYLVNEDSLLFDLASCAPLAKREKVEKEVARMIDQGLFAWAIREKRGVFFPAEEQTGQCLLHVIAANNRIRGMFFGALEERKQSIADTSLTLLSIVLMRVANALEELEFRRFLKNQTVLLEQQVEERTKALTQSEAKLKKAMRRAHRLAAEAKKASEAKSDFLAKMSHELRTPLNGIIGMTEVALSTQPDVRQAQFLNIIDRESTALLKLINNILDFSKVEAGKLSLENAPFDLRGVVDEVADSVALKAAQKGLNLSTYIDPRMATLVMGDAFRLKQVLLNLAGNALKFTPSGEIFIKCEPIEDSRDRIVVRLMVMDTGIGIPKEKRAVIFKGFSQADDSTTRQYGGTGLGITISSQLLELMGGTLSLASEEGRGSTFAFTLGFEKQTPITTGCPLSIDNDGQRALLVGVSARQLDVLSNYLAAMGYAVESAPTADEALEGFETALASKRLPDAIFIDMGISENQRSLLGIRIGNLYGDRQVLIILVAHINEIAQYENTAHTKIDAYLPKPIKLGDLKTVLTPAGAEGEVPNSPMMPFHGEMSPPISESPQATGGRILLVDDYATNQKVAFIHLSRAGYEVDIAEDGGKAVAAFKEKHYDLILMDIQMPVMDGYAASSAIRALEARKTDPHCGSIPIVAMTAHAFEQDEQKCREAGMNDFISKPIRREALLAMVSKRIAPSSRHGETVSPSPGQNGIKSDSGGLSPMDFQTAVDEFGSREVVMEVATELLKNIEVQIDIMKNALGAEDYARVQRESHAIKAHHLSALAAGIETHSREKDKPSIGPLLDAFSDEFTRLKQFVTRQNQSWEEGEAPCGF
jgi:two-component system, sensor histidine kinase and response regulator